MPGRQRNTTKTISELYICQDEGGSSFSIINHRRSSPSGRLHLHEQTNTKTDGENNLTGHISNTN